MKIAGREILVRGRLVRVARLEGDGLEMPSNVEEVLSDVRRARADIDVFTFVQLLPHTEPRFGYRMEWDNFAALPVTTYEHWLTKQIDFKVRNKVRKGEKNGLSVREVAFDDDLVKGISAIYNETPVRQGKPFWHYGKDLDKVRLENSSFLESSILIGAFVANELVGFLKVVVNADRGQAGVVQILSMIRHRDKAPTNALIAQAVRSCADRKIPNIVYANFSYGKKERDSLADFKEANGFKRIEVPRYYVPLTLKGRAALRVGAHHRLAEVIPAPLLEKVRKIRSLWYGRRLPVAKEAL
jgi:hypothetical protein